jgi:hypothetical protein
LLGIYRARKATESIVADDEHQTDDEADNEADDEADDEAVDEAVETVEAGDTTSGDGADLAEEKPPEGDQQQHSRVMNMQNNVAAGLKMIIRSYEAQETKEQTPMTAAEQKAEEQVCLFSNSGCNCV